MPLLPAIQGASQFFIGANSTYTNATTGGAWSSGNTSIATINASTGVATGVSQGSTQVIYTVGSDSTALNITVNAKGRVTNGFNPTLVLDALRPEVLWRSQGQSNSGRYFTDFHPLVDEEVLEDLANTGTMSYSDYLSSLTDAVILECVNLVYTEPQLVDKTQLVFNKANNFLKAQEVEPDDPEHFVGISWDVRRGDYAMKAINLLLMFNQDVTFNMYLYNDFSLPPAFQMEVSASAYQQEVISLQNNAILNYLTPDQAKGGSWRFGYFQGDLGEAKALTYPYNPACFKACEFWPFTAPVITDALDAKNYDRSQVKLASKMFGVNLEASTMIDATNNIISNPSLWGNLIGLKMACRIIELYIYSSRTNGVERKMKAIGGLDDLNTILNGRPYNYMSQVPAVTGLVKMAQDAAQVIKQGFRSKSPI